jgi:hypothetical protein
MIPSDMLMQTKIDSDKAYDRGRNEALEEVTKYISLVQSLGFEHVDIVLLNVKEAVENMKTS